MMNDWEVRVISETQQLRDRIRWLEKGLKLVSSAKIESIMKIKDIARAVLDGEPTTADEYNESQEIEGIELKHEQNAEIAEYDRKYWEEEE